MTEPPCSVVMVCGVVASAPVSSAIAMVSPSGSESLPVTLEVNGIPSNRVNVSSDAIGDAL